MLEVFETYAPTHPDLWVGAQQREYRVQWRFISLRRLNKDIDYDTHYPPEYEAGHAAGLRLCTLPLAPSSCLASTLSQSSTPRAATTSSCSRRGRPRCRSCSTAAGRCPSSCKPGGCLPTSRRRRGHVLRRAYPDRYGRGAGKERQGRWHSHPSLPAAPRCRDLWSRHQPAAAGAGRRRALGQRRRPGSFAGFAGSSHGASTQSCELSGPGLGPVAPRCFR